MSVTVVAQRGTRVKDAVAGCCRWRQLDRIAVHSSEVAANLEENSLDIVFLQDFHDAVGVARMRAVIESEQQGLGRQFSAKNLIAVLLFCSGTPALRRRKTGFIFFQNLVALILLPDECQIVVPSLTPHS